MRIAGDTCAHGWGPSWERTVSRWHVPQPGEAWPGLLGAQENSPRTLGVSCFQPRNLGSTGRDCIDRGHPTVCPLGWPGRVASGPRRGLNSVGMLVLP